MEDRKEEQLRLAASPHADHRSSTGLELWRLRNRALPERDLDSVSLHTEFLSKQLHAPLLVSAMTGGAPKAALVNQRLAKAASERGLPFALGSGRRLLEDPGAKDTYAAVPRPPLVFANIGAAQVAGPEGALRAERIVDLLHPDGLYIHLNPLQEAVQPEGEARFAGVAEGIARVVSHLRPLPVLAKEVGFGMTAEDVRLLVQTGVAGIDVAGSGGTNWAIAEGLRDATAKLISDGFADWGVPTAYALLDALKACDGVPIVASGGIRTGVDAAKCLALGATLVGVARPLLLAAMQDRVGQVLDVLTRQLHIATWVAGLQASDELAPEHLTLVHSFSREGRRVVDVHDQWRCNGT